MAVIEGHAEHVMDAVAPDLLPVAAQAARRRWTAAASPRPGSHACSAACSVWR